MSTTTLRDARTTHGTGHPRLHPIHGGHLFAGEGAYEPMRLRTAHTVFGSDPSCDVVVPRLAARHFEIRRDESDHYVVHALEGTVQVNGRGGAPATVHTGDVIRSGDWAASFARDASTDQLRERGERYLAPHGVLGHLEHLAFLLYGLSTLPQGHRSRQRAADQREAERA